MGKWVSSWITGWLKRVMGRHAVDSTVSSFIGNLTYALLLTVFILAALSRLGIQTASFIAILGAVGLAIGLALQGSLSNFAAGVMMILLRPLKVGDYVEAGGVAGTVEGISIFCTTLATPDNKTVIVPNAQIMDKPITNYSTKATRRLDLMIGVSYEADVRQVKQELESILNADERVLGEPLPTIAMHSLGDSSVNFAVRPWVKASDYWPLYFDLHERIKLRFDEVGISIPYPQMDVHLKREATE